MHTGTLLGFDIQPNGDVIIEASGVDDPYAHYVTITAQDLAGMAAASAARRASQTIVVFRTWLSQRDGQNVIALFPGIDEGNGKCSSYEHTGQHGGADYAGVISRTRPARPEEYAPLKRELESPPFGYLLIVRKRAPRH